VSPVSDERLLSFHRRVALAAARVRAHLARCAICTRGSGVWGGLCQVGAGLANQLGALQLVLEGLQRASPTP